MSQGLGNQFLAGTLIDSLIEESTKMGEEIENFKNELESLKKKRGEMDTNQVVESLIRYLINEEIVTDFVTPIDVPTYVRNELGRILSAFL